MEDLVTQLASAYAQKRVLVTGHNGFKGSWLVGLLGYFGAKTLGISLPVSHDSPFKSFHKNGSHKSHTVDIRDFETLREVVTNFKPKIIFHLAAQSLVLESYEKPRETFETNVMGTANLLQAVDKKFCQGVIVATTDKVYKNNNEGTSFDESHELWGHDPYSLSKTGTELVVDAWRNLPKSNGCSFVTVRAGNVFGPGDRAKNRLIPDIIRSIVSGQEITLRNPESVRPWQFVLDPLVGYLILGKRILDSRPIEKSYNFGPDEHSFITVRELASIFSHYRKIELKPSYSQGLFEARVLKLNSKLAKETLNWRIATGVEKGVEITVKYEKQEFQLEDIEAVIESYLGSFGD